MNAPMPLAQLQHTGGAVTQMADQKIDMFSLRGFELAQRIAKAFATSDAVPAQFRLMVFKKDKDGGQWIENPAAIGNCLVAIETARAVGMSITAVMQQANIIEGKLSWSAQFVIAAVNASGRFQPLRFDIKSRGIIKAKYREKLGWNKAKGGFDFEDKVVEIEDLVCIAWTLPADFATPKGIYTLAQARAADLPIIESSPVSMKLAVEEGWYSKPGSKWQTEMKHQMLQYRSGAFFGRIHAPDIVMGMGQTTEELRDVGTTFDLAADGTISPTPISELRPGPTGHIPPVDIVEPTASAAPAQAPAQDTAAAKFDLQAFIDRAGACTDMQMLQVLCDEVETMPAGPDRDAAMAALTKRDDELAGVVGDPAEPPAQQPAARGRRSASSVSAE